MIEVDIPEMEVIQRATITDAKILNMENELSQLTTGFLANIVATQDDPTQHISIVEQVIFVMKEGNIYEQ